ncbi:MAG: MucB/RseB C-terminal domain-containing protein [Candidatus Obscuribacterales bacterium]|nr:MucB/RseB C-terminal domain-containing protein [Steroidobacteraceae bacterium]
MTRTAQHWVSKRLIFAVAACLSAWVAQAAETDAHLWLDRMTRALATRNYDGQFLHLANGRTENMRIIHRVVDGAVTERLVSLDGSGRELIRTDTEVACYLPDQRTVLVERRTDRDPLLANVPAYSEQLAAYYHLAAPRTGRVLGRSAQLITILPRDRYRYGYHLWLDQATAMPLKSELRDNENRVIEQMVFAELRLLASVDAALLKPAMSTEGFRWIRQEVRARRLVVNPDGRVEGWAVVNPPNGFRLTATQVQNAEGSKRPVRQMVFSDGLASVSVFIESKAKHRPDQVGLARMGAAFAFVVDMQDHWVTAVGEVPPSTVEAIARAMQRERVVTRARDTDDAVRDKQRADSSKQ